MSIFPSAYWFGLILWGIVFTTAASGLTMMSYHFYTELKLKVLKYRLRKLVEKRKNYESMLTSEELTKLNELS
jgi:hypothetical protein